MKKITKEEIKEFIKHSKNVEENKWHEFTFFTAELFGKDVVIMRTGFGKVFAAMMCQKLIDTYELASIIFTGVAGSINPELKIGDIVIGKDCMQHDLDAEELGFSRGAIPLTSYKIFVTDKKLRNLALKVRVYKKKVKEGTILTGDQFITKNKLKRYSYLIDELKGDAIEMEGASIAHVCTINKIPFLIVRTISDKADENAVHDFSKFLPIVAKNSFKIVKGIFENM